MAAVWRCHSTMSPANQDDVGVFMCECALVGLHAPHADACAHAHAHAQSGVYAGIETGGGRNQRQWEGPGYGLPARRGPVYGPMGAPLGHGLRLTLTAYGYNLVVYAAVHMQLDIIFGTKAFK